MSDSITELYRLMEELDEETDYLKEIGYTEAETEVTHKREKSLAYERLRAEGKSATDAKELTYTSQAACDALLEDKRAKADLAYTKERIMSIKTVLNTKRDTVSREWSQAGMRD